MRARAVLVGAMLGSVVIVGAADAGRRPAHRSHVTPAVAQTPAQRFLQHNCVADRSVHQTASGLQYKVLTAGAGTARPGASDVAQVTYIGRLIDGSEFDRSDAPVAMPLDQVVPGFAEALRLMPRGSRYRFWLPPALAYGDRAAGPIPPGSILVFDVQLINFAPPQDPELMLPGNTSGG